MATQPTIHVYKEVKRFKTVSHYEVQGLNKILLLSERIHLSVNQQFAKSTPVFWLKESSGHKWSTKYLTGLFKTSYKGIFKGDTQHKKNLLLFAFDGGLETLKIAYYPNYYTRNIKDLIKDLK